MAMEILVLGYSAGEVRDRLNILTLFYYGRSL